MSQARKEIGRQIASGAAWMIFLRMCDRAVGLISTVVLARLLVPEDFGLVALAMSLIAILEMIGEFSFELALIRDQKATRTHYDTAWTAKTIKELIVFAILNLSAGLVADFFAEPRLKIVIHILSVAVLLQGFESIRLIDLRKELQFDKEFMFGISVRLSGFVATVALAALWRDYWALVVGTIFGRAIRLMLSYVIKPYRPRLTLRGFGEIFAFSKWLIIDNVLGAFRKRSPALFIGRLADAQTLGFFTVSYGICNLASSELIAPVKRALFPGYAKLASDIAALRRTYVENFSLIVTAAMPIAAGIGITADLIVPILLGQKWLDAIPVMQVLALAAAVMTVNQNSRPLYMAANRAHLLFWLSGSNVAVLLPMLWFGVAEWGAVGAAWALVASSAAVLLLDLTMVARILGMSVPRLLGAIWRIPVAIAVMVLAVALLKQQFEPATQIVRLVGQFSLCALVGSAAYAGTLLLLWRIGGRPDGPEATLLSLIQRTSRRLLARTAGQKEAVAPITSIERPDQSS